MNSRHFDAPDRATAVAAESGVSQLRHGPDSNSDTVTNDAQNVFLTESRIATVGELICGGPNGQPGTPGYRPQNLPISDRILGTPTASRAKIGEIAMRSQADEGGESKSRKNRLKRLGCLLAGFVALTVIMLIL